MITAAVKEQARLIARHIALGLSHTGVTPNTLTVVGLLLNMLVAAVLAAGHLTIGGALLLFAGAFDMLDGALAKSTGQISRFGAFLDSTLDRYSELIVFLGLLVFFQAADQSALTIALVYAAAFGSVMVSYARARAEALGFDAEVGLLARPERIILLALGLLLGYPVIALWVLAVLTNITAIQRILHVWRLQRHP